MENFLSPISGEIESNKAPEKLNTPDNVRRSLRNVPTTPNID
jgi:hypothetical protein